MTGNETDVGSHASRLATLACVLAAPGHRVRLHFQALVLGVNDATALGEE